MFHRFSLNAYNGDALDQNHGFTATVGASADATVTAHLHLAITQWKFQEFSALVVVNLRAGINAQVYSPLMHYTIDLEP